MTNHLIVAIAIYLSVCMTVGILLAYGLKYTELDPMVSGLLVFTGAFGGGLIVAIAYIEKYD